MENDHEFVSYYREGCNKLLEYFKCNNCEIIIYKSKADGIFVVSNQNYKEIFKDLSLKYLRTVKMSCDEFVIKQIIEWGLLISADTSLYLKIYLKNMIVLYAKIVKP